MFLAVLFVLFVLFASMVLCLLSGTIRNRVFYLLWLSCLSYLTLFDSIWLYVGMFALLVLVVLCVSNCTMLFYLSDLGSMWFYLLYLLYLVIVVLGCFV